MSNDIVLSYYDCLLRFEDVKLLKGPDWLNDVIIGFYFEYLDKKINDCNKCKLLYISPEVTQLLKMSDTSQLAVFLDPLDASNSSTVFFPLNDCNSKDAAGGSHWSLLVYSQTDKTFYHFDSYKSVNKSLAEQFTNNIANYFLRRSRKNFVEMKCPQQRNGYDCGLFVLCLADVISQCVQENSKIAEYNYNNVQNLVKTKRSSMLKLIDILKKNSDQNE